MADLSVFILTYNEEQHIERCIRSLGTAASDVFVIDSYSTDRTVEIATQCGATVLQHKFVNQSAQFQWAMDTVETTTAWVMRLDADEILEPVLAAEINSRLPALGPTIVGVNLRRKHIFMGRHIRHGGRYPLLLLRIFRKGHGRIEQKWMDEHIVVWGGDTITFDGDFADHNLNDLTYFTEKHNAYATREAIEVLSQRYDLLPRDQVLNSASASTQASMTRLVKESVYNRLPLWAAPMSYFLFRYIIQLGFLDGQPGLIYHFLQGFWYRFLVGAKVAEYDATLRPLSDRKNRIDSLERMTGIKLKDPPRSAN